MVWGFRRVRCQMPPQHLCPGPGSPQLLLTWRGPGQLSSCSGGCELGERTETSGTSLAFSRPLPTPSLTQSWFQPYLALPGAWVRDARLGSRVLRAPWLSLRIRNASWGGEGRGG